MTSEIQARVTEVKTIHFSFNPPRSESESYNYHFVFQDSFNKEDSILRILVTAIVRSNKDLEQENAVIKVLNDYHIEDIDQFVTEGKLILPEELNKVFFSISYSHMRALLASHLSGTYLANALPPIVPIDDIYEAKKKSLENKK